MLPSRFFVSTCIASAVGWACGGSSSPASESGASSTTSKSGQSCDEIAASARAEVQAAISENLACNVDADCVHVGFSARCFDSCSRVVSASGVSAVDTAKERVNGAQCATFEQRGCKLIVPPCVPPAAPACSQGRCI